MDITNKYYTDIDFLNIAYAVDIALDNHFANLFFGGNNQRVIYSSNAYAMRKRADNNEGNINLPFINYRTMEYEPGARTRWDAYAYTKGMYIPELQQKVRFAPITMTYEASFWCHTDIDLRYAFQEFLWDTDNKTLLKPIVEIDGQEVAFPAHLSYSDLDFEPEYTEQDWLERNKIHSASIGFQIETLALKTNLDVSLTDKVILNFAIDKGLVSEEEDRIKEVHERVTDYFE